MYFWPTFNVTPNFKIHSVDFVVVLVVVGVVFVMSVVVVGGVMVYICVMLCLRILFL